MNYQLVGKVAIPFISIAALSLAQVPGDAIGPVTNWPAPLYWRVPGPKPAATNRGGRREESVVREAQVPMGPAASTLGVPAVFVAITPCRLVDTRAGSLPFGGPPLAAGEIRVIPVPSGSCSIPAGAVAYSLNIAVVPVGTMMRFLTAWNDGAPQPNSATVNDRAGLVTSNAAIVPAGNLGAIDIYVTDATNVVVDINGYYSTENLSPAGFGSFGIGEGALGVNSASYNTAVGFTALARNTTGSTDTAVGYLSLNANTTGADNTGVGNQALASNVLGTNNTAVGSDALFSNTSNSNSALGGGALTFNAAGSSNTAVGYNALHQSLGNSNIAVGASAGANLTAGDNNIYIGNSGTVGDSATLRIGTSQAKAFIAGVRNVTTGAAAIPVMIDTNGQLGTASSSRSVKRDIADMPDATGTVMSLHPVTFRYRAQGPDAPVQYGLIAEEVAEIAPDLVARSADGQIETVYYDKVNALLLKQVQTQHSTIESQASQLKEQATEIEKQAARLAELQTMVQDLLERSPKP
jgi:Chaperone of endosialidase